MIWLYRLLFVPLMRVGFILAAPFSSKAKKALELRREFFTKIAVRHSKEWWKMTSLDDLAATKALQGAIWFHVSSGEFEYAKPVIRALKAAASSKPVIVTFFSPSVSKSIAAFPSIDAFSPSPYDTHKSWSQFLDRLKPSCLAIARTDIWPEMILAAQAHQIPIHLFSATLTPQSGRVASRFGRAFYKPLISAMNEISCVSSDDQTQFLKYETSTNIRVEGDTRFDQVAFRLEHAPAKVPGTVLSRLKSNQWLCVCGSTWPEDERIIIDAFVQVRAQMPTEHKLVMVPHEPTPKHINALRAALQRLGIKSVLFSTIQNGDSWTEPFDALVIDKVGVLAELYDLSDLAFVGGSFRKSIHSVMEASASGAFCLFGPYHTNNREALELKKMKLAREVSSADHLSKLWIEDLSLEASNRGLRRRNILQFMQKKQGVSELIANRLLTL